MNQRIMNSKKGVKDEYSEIILRILEARQALAHAIAVGDKKAQKKAKAKIRRWANRLEGKYHPMLRKLAIKYRWIGNIAETEIPVYSNLSAEMPEVCLLENIAWKHLLKNLDQYDMTRPFEPWAVTIIRNKWYEIARGNQDNQEKFSPEELNEEIIDVAYEELDDVVGDKLMFHVLRETLDQATQASDEKEIVRLLCDGQLDREQIADALNITRADLDNRIRAIYRRARKFFNEHEQSKLIEREKRKGGDRKKLGYRGSSHVI